MSDLRLRFLSDESWDNGLPLKIGVQTTYSISVTSDEGAGIETFVCYAPLGTEVDRTVVNLASTGSEDTVQCTITPDKAGDLQLAIIALNGTVPSKTSLWTVIADSGESINPEEANRELGVALMILLGIAGIIVLIAAIFLTRRVMEETERETFELCPACGGEIEGDEEICPHCDFQLTSGFSRFHDCEECGTSIPSAMDHCPYCGAVQDVSSHYERRERKELVPLPDEEEDEGEDEEAILIGTEDFDDQMENFGVSEDSIEDDWESGLEEAESQIRSIEEEYEQELSSEEDEDEEIVSTNLQDQLEAGRDIDSFLAKKGKRRALKDEEVELSASDAGIRKDIFDLTGEEGVLPGEKVVFDELSDPSAQVGSELQLDKTSDFSSLSSEAGHTEGISDGVEEENPKPKRRRSIRRKSKEEGSDESQD